MAPERPVNPWLLRKLKWMSMWAREWGMYNSLSVSRMRYWSTIPGVTARTSRHSTLYLLLLCNKYGEYIYWNHRWNYKLAKKTNGSIRDRKEVVAPVLLECDAVAQWRFTTILQVIIWCGYRSSHQNSAFLRCLISNAWDAEPHQLY